MYKRILNTPSLFSLSMLLTLILLVLTSDRSIGQNKLNPSWIKVLPSNDQTTAEAWGITEDQSGNVYWATSSDSLNQGLDIVCYKYDSKGNEIWDEPYIYGGPGTQQAYICINDQDEVLIGGRTCSGFVTSCNMLLLKLDLGGNHIWDRSLDFEAGGYEEIDGLVVRDEQIFCGGWAQQLNPSIYESDIGLWSLDQDGTTIWTNFLGNDNSAEHQDGHFVVDDDYIFAAGLWNGTGLANLYNGHAFLGKFSKENGNLVDSTLFGYQSNDFLDIENALGMTSDGEFLYVTGYSTPESSNDWQIFISKFDKDLNQQWYTDWGGSGNESARGILVKNNIIYIAGLTGSPELISSQNRDALLLQFDTNGNYLQHHTWGDSLMNSFLDLSYKHDHIYLTGIGESSAIESKRSAFLLAVNEIPLGTKESPANPVELVIYPNPSNREIYVDLKSNTQNFEQINLYDSSGKLIYTESIVDQEQRIQFNLYQKGLYFIRLRSPVHSYTRPVLIH